MRIISVNDVWLKYRVEFKENGKLVPEDFWGLKGVSFEVQQGEAVAVIGENGAGKSTLLRIIAGMLKPDKGLVQVQGRAAGLIDLGGGFHKELTGKENIYLVSSLFGFSRAETDARYDAIVKFAAIGRFINAPVKTYSQGMYMRLGFAIAIHVDPEILLIDESFVVGDTYAQRKCINKLFELREQGKTILFVSHDLEIAKRVCSRGILLRGGALVKDGPINEVCNYYTETVGDKKGIAFQQRGPLGVVFNNGKLILRWKNNTLTPQTAGCAAMFLSGREYISSLADWQIEKSGDPDGEIIATGKWADMPVSVRWRISFVNDHELAWEITVDFPIDISPERLDARMVFDERYARWFTLGAEKDFPRMFLHSQQWQCDWVEDSLNGVIGLRGEDGLPVIVFDRLQDNRQVKCHIGNTGSDIGGRILYYSGFTLSDKAGDTPEGRMVFRSKVLFFETVKEKEVQEYVQHCRQLLEESVVLRKDPISIFCRDHKIEIYWQEKLLTRLVGLNTQFRHSNNNYSAANGQWGIRRVNDDEILVTISWGALSGLRQLWRLQIKDKETIAWEIIMESSAEAKIINRQAELLLAPEYARWFTNDESGEFQNLEKKGGVVVLSKYANNCVGVEKTGPNVNPHLPQAAFYDTGSAAIASYIFKLKNETVPMVKMQYVSIDKKEQATLFPGKGEYFKGEIKIDAVEECSCSGNAGIHSHQLKRGNMQFIFSNGKGKILWKGIELTKGLGLYSSVFLFDRWHDSSQAHWEVREEEGKLTAVGFWPWVPAKQTWEVALVDQRTIRLKIYRDIWDKEIFSVEREHVCLMLSGRYKGWFSPRQIKAEFPARFIAHNGVFWERLWCADRSNPIGVDKGSIRGRVFPVRLPSLLFEAAGDCRARHAIIENTDDLFQARVLQYEMDSDAQANGDTCPYFDGSIKIAG